MWENVRKLYANTTPFYKRALRILRFWYPVGVLEPIPCGYQGMTVHGRHITEKEHCFYLEVKKIK